MPKIKLHICFKRFYEMKPKEWLEKTKEKLDISSDYKLAKIIGVKATAISNIRIRNNGMDNYTAARIADILEIERMTVIIDMEILKAKNNEKLNYWKRKKEMYLN